MCILSLSALSGCKEEQRDNLMSDVPQIYYLDEDRTRIYSQKIEYEYDSKREILVGRSTRNIFRLGDEVVIKVVSASKEARTIDFSIVKRVSEDEKEYVRPPVSTGFNISDAPKEPSLPPPKSIIE